MLLHLTFLVSLLAASSLAETLPERVFYAPEDAEYHFEDFIATYNKQYANEREKYYRFNVFKGNLKKINELNSKGEATYGINQFGDMSHYEFMQYYTGTEIDSVSGKRCKDVDVIEGNVPAPDSIDWRKEGKVTRVKNQEKCDANSIFSCIANLESQYAIKYNKLLEFSEQQVVDCCDGEQCGGCGAYGPKGLSIRAWLSKHGDLELERDYPFKGKIMQCSADKNKTVAHVTSCYWYRIKTVEALKQLLATGGPVSVYVNSDTILWYRGGILRCGACEFGGVSLLLVGYGKDGDRPYWILKNSWGEKWGEKGYVRIEMAEVGKDGCFMAQVVMSGLVE